MRYLWVDAGNDPDFVKGDKNGITGYFLPAYDSRATHANMALIQSKGHVAGFYVGAGWWDDLSPAQYAQKAYDFWLSLQQQGTLPDLRVQFNLEEHDPARIIAIFEAWRTHAPKLGTSWALEGMQGGWVKGAQGSMQFIDRLVAAHVRVVPECFGGATMWRRESDMVLRDLTAAGLPESLVTMFYDGAQLGVGADGYVFTQGRLPA